MFSHFEQRSKRNTFETHKECDINLLILLLKIIAITVLVI